MTDLMTVDEVAALLAVNPVTVRRRMERGEFGDIYRDGRKCVRIRRAGYDKYVAARIKAPAKVREQVCKACGYSQREAFTTCPECGEEV